MWQTWLIAGHELTLAVRTRRALWLAMAYLAAALLGGAGFVVAVRLLEQQAAEQMMQRGMSANEATSALSLMSEPALRKLAAFFAGVEPEQLAQPFQSSIVVPFIFWGSLTFLPLLIALTSFDQVVNDLQSRSIRYSTLRTSRLQILGGKLLSQGIVFVVLTAIASLVLTALAAVMLESFPVWTTAWSLAWMVLLLVPYGLCYVAITAFCSSLVRSPLSALLLTLGLLASLRVAGWFDYIPLEHGAAWLRHLQWLSPSTYESGLWLSGSSPIASTTAYLGFASVFAALAAWRLGARDL